MFELIDVHTHKIPLLIAAMLITGNLLLATLINPLMRSHNLCIAPSGGGGGGSISADLGGGSNALAIGVLQATDKVGQAAGSMVHAVGQGFCAAGAAVSTTAGDITHGVYYGFASAVAGVGDGLSFGWHTGGSIVGGVGDAFEFVGHTFGSVTGIVVHPSMIIKPVSDAPPPYIVPHDMTPIAAKAKSAPKPATSHPAAAKPLSNIFSSAEVTNAPAGSGPMNIHRYVGSGYPGDSYAWGNCTYWAFMRRGQAGEPIPTSWGNAATWATDALLQGYKVDHTPSQYAIMQIPNVDYGLGHVAFVEKVDSDGTWHISEMNVAGYNVIDDQTMPASAASSYYFIHAK